MLKNLSDQNSLLAKFISEIRDVHVQKDSMRFRINMQRIGEIMAYEISKTLNYEVRTVSTPLGRSIMQLPVDNIVNATILRAGLPFHMGILNYFDNAENAFINEYRKYTSENNFDIVFEHISGPDVHNKVLIISDPMLASGSSMHKAYKALLKNGTPKKTHIVTIIASQEGIDYIISNLKNDNVTIWAGAIDPKLNDKAYIVPGLGDAGDLAFGEKL